MFKAGWIRVRVWIRRVDSRKGRQIPEIPMVTDLILTIIPLHSITSQTRRRRLTYERGILSSVPSLRRAVAERLS